MSKKTNKQTNKTKTKNKKQNKTKQKQQNKNKKQKQNKTKKQHFHWKVPHFCHRKTILFWLTLSPKDPYFLNAWFTCTSLYTIVCPGISPPPSLCSLPVTSVSPTEVLPGVLPYLNTVVYHAGSTTERYAPGRLYAKPSALTIRNFVARTHNARLKHRYKCTRSLATSLQNP